MKYKIFINFIFGLIYCLSAIGGLLYAQPETPLERIIYTNYEELQSSNAIPPKTYKAFQEESTNNTAPQPIDFTMASARSMPTVVHISTTRKNQADNNTNRSQIYDYLEKDKTTPRISSGSGVIVSTDGYIVTNYHLVKDAKILQVTLHNKKTFEAELVGRDANTDLALIKINEYNLQYIKFGDSDKIQVGEWVLAVGNPFNLTSTVTAGIVSAKGRNLDILDAENAIESFIQTDAVVNQGNSGGALVNIYGELIGINTAIYTLQGSFAGYSFAVPVNIVKKVISDLREFQTVQRAFIGVTMRNLDTQLANIEKIKTLDGVFVENVQLGSSAEKAGLLRGDVIYRIGQYDVSNIAEFNERMANFRPGESVLVSYLRNNEERYVMLVLRNENNEVAVIKDQNIEFEKKMGIKLEDLLPTELNSLNLSAGVRVYQLTNGIVPLYTSIKKGFIITKINKVPMANSQQLESSLSKLRKGDVVLIEGIYINSPKLVYYSFYMP